MEPTTIFLAAVAFVGVSQLATSATKSFRKNRQATHQAASRTRSDWYCFFNCSALYGKSADGPNRKHLSKNSHTSKQSRPRIYK